MPETEAPKITFRPLTEEDYPLITEWWKNDEDHKVYSPNYFRVQGTQGLMFCDESGPVFAASIRPMVRIGIQFCNSRSDPDREKRRRVARALQPFLHWLETEMRARKVTEIIYNSVSPDLIAFVEKTAGYFHSNDEYRKKLYVVDDSSMETAQKPAPQEEPSTDVQSAR